MPSEIYARNEDIRAGDIIVTSGLDQLFPKGLILGRVLRVVSQIKGNFLFVEVVQGMPIIAY